MKKKRLDHDLENRAPTFSGFCFRKNRRPFPGFEIAGINIPARQVSGDYFDYNPGGRTSARRGNRGRFRAKGVPASLIMAILPQRSAQFRHRRIRRRRTF